MYFTVYIWLRMSRRATFRQKYATVFQLSNLWHIKVSVYITQIWLTEHVLHFVLLFLHSQFLVDLYGPFTHIQYSAIKTRSIFFKILAIDTP